MTVSLNIPMLLTAIFLVAKLWGVIDWSYWLVFAPLWVPFALLFCFLLIAGLFSAVVSIFKR